MRQDRDSIRDLQTVVEGGLCTGCGLCASMAPPGQVQMRISPGGQLRPHVHTPIEPARLEAILDACPGIKVVGPVPEAGASLHPVWGPQVQMHLGWATDPAVRHHAAAGGALTALGCHLLASGKVDAVLHVKASARDPVQTEAQVSRTPAEVIAGAQSRYGAGAPLIPLCDLLDSGTRVAVIAKPCDIAGVRNLQRQDPRAAELIAFTLTLFCGGLPSLHTPRRIAAYHGIADDEIALFRWRGEGWPGPTHIEAKDGRTVDMSYDQAWYDASMPWTYDIQFRCKVCVDAIGELADVSCPDGWLLVDGKPRHAEAPGRNVVIARTRRGAELVRDAVAAGALELAPVSFEDFERMHADHITRKLENPARVRALGLEGQPAPVFDGFRADRMREMLGPAGDAAAERGARDRIRRGANREPPA